MRFLKIFIFTLLLGLVSSCNDATSEKDLFSIEIAEEKKMYTVNEELSVTIKNKKNREIETISLSLDGVLVSEKGKENIPVSLSGSRLGKRSLSATITSEGETYNISTDIVIVASEKPKLYTFKILESYPHDITAYTQGLEFKNDTLYESTGQYRKSSLRQTDYKTGDVLQKVDLEDHYFGEGLTILNNKIYQLTYKEKTGFIYNLKTLERTGTFVYNESKEGWGLCNNGTAIFKSDGTEKVWTLNPETLAEEGFIEIYTNTSKIPRVNELEWVEGKIYANIYQKGAIAIVNPANGAVEGVIDLNSLKENVTQHETLDVLNGIAYNGEKDILYVTGKNWDKLFKIQILEK